MTDMDSDLKSLFAGPAAAPDEAFVKRIEHAVRAEQRMLSAQTATRRRFLVDVAGTFAVMAAFFLIWKTTPTEFVTDALSQAPGLAAVMLLLMWLVVQARQMATAR